MRKLFDAFLTARKTSPQTGDGGFNSRGAKAVSGYSDTPPPPRKPPSGGGNGGNNNGGYPPGSGSGGGLTVTILPETLRGDKLSLFQF